MIFTETAISDVVIVDPTPAHDARGCFARLHCPEDFADAGYPFMPVQTSLSRNTAKGTLRGLHWQDPPFAEAKLVRVVRGRIFDVVVDLRRESPTFKEWVGTELSAEAARALLLPQGVAHGFLTLVSDTDVLYQIASVHVTNAAKGARWNDPAFAIEWPAKPRVISERDLSFPPFLDYLD